MPAVVAPRPVQPSPVEVANWQGGRSSAKTAYENTLAQSQYGRQQAGLTNQMQQRQLQYNQQQGRQTFDDPYIGRGILNSGIRGGGLTNFYANAGNDQANAQQQYLAQLGQYNLSDTMAGSSYTTGMNNIALQEQARRAQLATEIKGIV